jgi:CRISPR/Cas system endoribonuclease Cas6 (RAMP superfamily)
MSAARPLCSAQSRITLFSTKHIREDKIMRHDRNPADGSFFTRFRKGCVDYYRTYQEVKQEADRITRKHGLR